MNKQFREAQIDIYLDLFYRAGSDLMLSREIRSKRLRPKLRAKEYALISKIANRAKRELSRPIKESEND